MRSKSAVEIVIVPNGEPPLGGSKIALELQVERACLLGVEHVDRRADGEVVLLRVVVVDERAVRAELAPALAGPPSCHLILITRPTFGGDAGDARVVAEHARLARAHAGHHLDARNARRSACSDATPVGVKPFSDVSA